jgi:transcriptional antiterminator RfaH
MPILEQEPCIFPPDLLENVSSTDLQHPSVWMALYTQPRSDKLLMRKLFQQEVHFYSPIIEKKSISPNGRKRVSYLPLFPNYVFLFGDEHARLEALKTNLVVKVLDIVQQKEFLRDIQIIRKLIATGSPVTLEAKLEPGQRVRILKGSMAGTEGTILERRGKSVLVVAVNFLQQGASVLVDDFVVEKVEA